MLAERYNQLLADLPLSTPWQHPDSYSGYHLYVIRVDQNNKAISSKKIYQAMHASGVFVNMHYIPVYRHPYFENMGFSPGYCSEAEKYFKSAISLPLYPSLTIAQQDQVIAALCEEVEKNRQSLEKNEKLS
jgi:dTDP-4-amino-4,6-dideoxygalactose transaminase